MYDILKSFKFLPENAPYGFVVLENGKYIIAKKLFDHVLIINSLMGDIKTPIEKFHERGGIRMVLTYNEENKSYFAQGNLIKSKKTKSYKTSTDLCLFYNAEFIFLNV